MMTWSVLRKCYVGLTDVEDFSSLDFWLLFLLLSGSFSGAPASKATPSNGNDSVKLLYKTEPVYNKMKSLVLLHLQTRNILIGPRNYDVPL